MRADLATARANGVTLAEFLGEPPTPGRSRYDDTERNLWRALDQYNAALCPGCGQPHTRALFDTDADHQPRYTAGFVTCLGCKELLEQKDAQRIKDTQEMRRRTDGMKHPEDAKSVLSGHRHWRLWEQPPLAE